LAEGLRGTWRREQIAAIIAKSFADEPSKAVVVETSPNTLTIPKDFTIE